jgi:hypothetical protein
VERLSLSGFIAITADTLLIEYKIQGALERINRPSISPVAGRCHELWRHTCFELFLGMQGETAYWEVNLSPSGCWNIYHFDDYRTGMREEGTIGPPRCRIISDIDLLSLTCSLNFNGIIDTSSHLEIGICSVIEATDGSVGYWAIEHHGVQPDFHDRRGFQIQFSN